MSFFENCAEATVQWHRFKTIAAKASVSLPNQQRGCAWNTPCARLFFTLSI